MRPTGLMIGVVLSCLIAWPLAAQTTAPESSAGAPTTAPADDSPAIKLYARGDYRAVIELLTPEYRAGRANLQQRILLARAMLHLGQSPDALDVLQSVLEADKENPEANSLAGQILFAAGRHKEAVECLQQAYRLRKSPAAASALGQCYLALGETAKAKEHLAEALKEDIRNPVNSFLLGKLHLAGGAGALAERYLLMALEAGMDTVELHHLLGQAYLLQRKYVGPVLIRRIATPVAPGDVVEGHVVLAKLEGQADQYQVATRYCALYEGLHLQQALLREPPYALWKGKRGDAVDRLRADAMHMVAAAWWSGGQLDLAERQLALLEQAEGPTQRVLAMKVRLLIGSGKFAELDKVLGAALAAGTLDGPAVADAYYQAAVALRGDGRRDMALAMLRKADAIVPTSANILRALASLSRVTDRLDEARQYYVRLVELFPDATDIDELRNILRDLTEKTGGKHATSLPDDDRGD